MLTWLSQFLISWIKIGKKVLAEKSRLMTFALNTVYLNELQLLSIKIYIGHFPLIFVCLPHPQRAEGPQSLDWGKTICSCTIALSTILKCRVYPVDWGSVWGKRSARRVSREWRFNWRLIRYIADRSWFPSKA